MEFTLKKNKEQKTFVLKIEGKNNKNGMDIEDEEDKYEIEFDKKEIKQLNIKIEERRKTMLCNILDGIHIEYIYGRRIIHIGESKMLDVPEYNGAILKIECGEKHMMLLFEDGSVYAYGDNTYGQCGIDNSIFKTLDKLTEVKNLTNKKFENIFCSKNSSFFLLNGILYSCGSNINGSLGRPCKKKYDYNIDLINFPSSIFNVYTSKDVDYIFVMTDVWTLYGFGDNTYNLLAKNTDIKTINTPIKIKYIKYIIPPKEIKKITKIITYEKGYIIISYIYNRDFILVGFTDHLYNSINIQADIVDAAMDKDNNIFFITTHDPYVRAIKLLFNKKYNPEAINYDVVVQEDKALIHGLHTINGVVYYTDYNGVFKKLKN